MILDEIVASTRLRVAAAKEAEPLDVLRERALAAGPYSGPSFRAAFAGEELAFICEVKKASPSKGLIAADFDPLAVALEYRQAGAAAISVLTEPEFFQGDPGYLSQIAAAVPLPALRKDFIVDEYQIYEARLLGAAAVLLICAALSDVELAGFLNLASGLGLDALVEVHDEWELERALALGAQIVGVNNRDLKSFEIDLGVTVRLGAKLDEGVTLVAESGIHSAADIAALAPARPAAVLIGESLMRAEDKAAALSMLRNAYTQAAAQTESCRLGAAGDAA